MIEVLKTRFNFKNIIQNWWVVISMLAFLALNLRWDINIRKGIWLAMFLNVYIIGKYNKSFLEYIKNTSKKILLLSAVSYYGTCSFIMWQFKMYLDTLVQGKGAFTLGVLRMLPFVCVILSLPYCIIFFSKAYGIIISSAKRAVKRMSKTDYIVMGCIAAVFFIIVIYAFNATYGFYSARAYGWDVVHTSDTPLLMQVDAWVNINASENDFRQPLFAVFAAPFYAPAYFISILSTEFEMTKAMLYAGVDIVLVIFTMFMVADLITTSRRERMILYIVLSMMFSSMIFYFMVEQYQTSVFWLILYVYCSVRKKKDTEIELVGATGTLLTSGVIALPVLATTEKSIISMIKKLAGSVVSFIFLFFMTGRRDLLLVMEQEIEQYKTFTGEAVTFADRMMQYTHLIASCFIAPKSGIAYTLGFPAWRMNDVTAVSWLGVVLLALCLISVILNRKNIMAVISASWVVYSFIILCVVGWGSAENGMTLYSLYYGWAFCVLIHLLLRYLFEKLKLTKGLWITELIIAATMVVINIPQIFEMISALRGFYPL